MDEQTWQNVMQRMKYQLQALAMPAQTQLKLFPDWTCKADELAEDYSHWCSYLLANDCGRLTQMQLWALETLNNYFDSMSGQFTSHLWTDEAIRTRSEWNTIRQMAAESLASFDWPLEPPAEPV